MDSFKSSHRRRARRYALQAIYQWQVSSEPLPIVEAQYIAEIRPDRVDIAYFRRLVRGVVREVEGLDGALTEFSDRPIDEVDYIERALLRLAAFELLHCVEVPYRVVINESVELAKVFGATDGHRYVNGIIDKLAHKARQAEIGEKDSNQADG